MIKKKIISMIILTKIPETYSENLINDFDIYFNTYNLDLTKCNNITGFNLTVEKWYEIYQSLKMILKKYYVVYNDNYDLKEDVNEYGYSFILLNNKYKDKYIKDVYQIVIKSAYPQKINKLFIDGMDSNDPYFPYVFNIVYQHIRKKDFLSPVNLFINFTFGVLTINKEKYKKFSYLPKVNKDITKNVTLFYRDIMESINKKLYYYIDTDIVFLKKENIEEVSKIFENNNIEFYVEEYCSNYLFIDKKKYIEIKNNRIIKIKGLKYDYH